MGLDSQRTLCPTSHVQIKSYDGTTTALSFLASMFKESDVSAATLLSDLKDAQAAARIPMAPLHSELRALQAQHQVCAKLVASVRPSIPGCRNSVAEFVPKAKVTPHPRWCA